MLLLLGLLGFASWEKKREVEKIRAELARCPGCRRQDSRPKPPSSSTSWPKARSAFRELEKEKNAVVQTHQSLEDEMRAALESKDVTISQLQGKLTVNILDRVLFDSGEADLKPAGRPCCARWPTSSRQHPESQNPRHRPHRQCPHPGRRPQPLPEQLGALHRPRHRRRPVPDRERRRGSRAAWALSATANSGPSPTTPRPKAARATAASPLPSSPKKWPAPTPPFRRPKIPCPRRPTAATTNALTDPSATPLKSARRHKVVAMSYRSLSRR